MEKDQVELLTQDKSRAQAFRSGDARRIIDSLPVQHPDKAAEAVRESITQEPEDTPSPPLQKKAVIEAFLASLPWVVYAFAIGATLVVAWIAGDGGIAQ